MSRPVPSASLMTALSGVLVAVLAGCQRQAPADVAVPAAPTTVASTDSTAAPAVSDATYRPPTAEQLYALVAPIALFPDRLVAQTLAASTHPDEIGTARDFVAQNGNLNGAALIDAADAQPWDPSVKSLVPFPAVLDQLANNAEWTAALGAAYASEPTDVMNAIQVMRGRARARGALQNSPQQTVEVSDRGPPADETVAEDNGIVPAPAQTILIEPAESDVVYVPTYDPDVVYGDPIVTRVYSRGWYEAPPPREDLVATGLISFGAGVLVGQLFSSHEHREPPRWGWNAWNTSWGGGRPGNPHYGRPAIVYDNHPYSVDRTTVVNRTVNIDRSVHIDNRHNFNNVDIHRSGRPISPVPMAASGQRPGGQPDYTHMQRPNFTPDMTRRTAANARPTLPPGPVDAPHGQPARRPDTGRFSDPREQRGPNGATPALAPRIAGQAQAPQAPHAIQPTHPTGSRPADLDLPNLDPRSRQSGTPHATPPGQQRPRVEQRPSPQPPREAPRPERQQPRPEVHQAPREQSRPQPQPQPQPPREQQAAPQKHEASPAHRDKHDDRNG